MITFCSVWNPLPVITFADLLLGSRALYKKCCAILWCFNKPYLISWTDEGKNQAPTHARTHARSLSLSLSRARTHNHAHTRSCTYVGRWGLTMIKVLMIKPFIILNNVLLRLNYAHIFIYISLGGHDNQSILTISIGCWAKMAKADTRSHKHFVWDASVRTVLHPLEDQLPHELFLWEEERRD